jgi:hypothetical protein
LEASLAFNGSGVHNRIHDWAQDLSNSIPVTASRMDAEHDDISSALSNTICRDGQSTTTARVPFASGLSAAAGTTTSVAYAQSNDTNTGMYFPATDQWGLVAGGTATLTSTSAALAAGVMLGPASSDGAALGSTSLMWSDLFLASGAVVNFNNADVMLTHAANALNIAGGTVTFDTAPTPASSDGAALGTSSVMWSDLFLASGGVVNWNNGDVTATHSTNALAFAGASSGYSFDAAVTVTGALSASGDFAIATNKFTIASASGNTAVAGTLAVTGATSISGALTANNAAGIVARNAPVAWCTFTTNNSETPTITLVKAFNVSSVENVTVEGTVGFRVNFASALPNADYGVFHTARVTNAATGILWYESTKATSTFDCLVRVIGGSATRANLTINLAFHTY